jgi:hypothetical protein
MTSSQQSYRLIDSKLSKVCNLWFATKVKLISYHAETVGLLNQKFFGRRAGRGLDCQDLDRVCFQKIC